MGCVVLGSQQQLLCSTNPLVLGIRSRHDYSQWRPDRNSRCGLVLGQVELLSDALVCIGYISVEDNKSLGTLTFI